MNKGFSSIPACVNAKLLIRHSFRPTLQGETDPDKIHLTKSGISAARILGESLNKPLGSLFSSPICRCRETLEAMRGHEDKEVNISSILGYSFIEDIEIANKMFSINSLKDLVFTMSKSPKVSGFIPAIEGIRNILNFIFATGNNAGKLDVYCTHDMHLALIDACLISDYRDAYAIKANWPNMLEGMWIWGERYDFNIIWRGNQKRFQNLLV